MKNLTKLTALTLTAALALTACGSSAAATAPADYAALLDTLAAPPPIPPLLPTC